MIKGTTPLSPHHTTDAVFYACSGWAYQITLRAAIEQSLGFFSPQSECQPKHPGFEETCRYFILLQRRQICGPVTGGVCGAMRLVQKRRNVFPWPKNFFLKKQTVLLFVLSDFIITASFLLIHFWIWSLKFIIFLYIQKKTHFSSYNGGDTILMLSVLSKNTLKKNACTSDATCCEL